MADSINVDELAAGPTVKDIELEVKKFGAAICVQPDVFVHAPGSTYADPLIHMWSLAFGKRLPYNTLRKYCRPKDWWEAVKERWAPKWFVKRYPIVYDTVELGEVWNNIVIPPDQRVYVVAHNGEPVYQQTSMEREGMAHCMFCDMPTPYYTEDDEGVRTIRIPGDKE